MSTHTGRYEVRFPDDTQALFDGYRWKAITKGFDRSLLNVLNEATLESIGTHDRIYHVGEKVLRKLGIRGYTVIDFECDEVEELADGEIE